MASTKLSKRTWFNIVLFGFIGQLAWNVENMYFNTFLFNKIGGTTDDINVMVAASAIAAVLTTFVMGALSDKLGKRKVFMCVGYILWGITVMAFAFISRENTASWFNLSDTAKIVSATVSIVIIMDCVMTFMGSTSNDAAFNAWITDITDDTNRGTVEGVNAILPIMALLIVTVGFGMGVTAVGYSACFIALGVLVIICGIVGIFTIEESGSGKKSSSNYFSDLVYGFRPSVVKENSKLYIALAAVCLYSSAFQVIMPYLFIYLQHYLGFDFNNLNITGGLIAGAVIAIAALIAGAILLGKLIDKRGKDAFIVPAVILFTLGLVLVYFMKTLSSFAVAAVIFAVGYALLGIILNAAVRDYTPKDKTGLFQGVRMIFAVLIPMIIGPNMGAWTINKFASYHELGTYVNDYGETVNAPVPEIFLAAAVIGIFVLVPVIVLRRKGFKGKAE
ncbi:MAG: MFS transporter [Clostridiales bacterium]|nr:MFS transporter [Clostridiales bacterium]